MPELAASPVSFRIRSLKAGFRSASRSLTTPGSFPVSVWNSSRNWRLV